MDSSKLLKWNLIRRAVVRTFMLMMALTVVSLMQMARDCEVRVIEPIMSNLDKCPLNFDSNSEFNLTGFLNPTSRFAFPQFGASSPLLTENLTKTVLKELMEKNLLQSDAKALCVGEKSASAVLALRHLGFFNAFGVERHPYFSLFKRRFVYELNFEDNHFDFIFSEDLDKVSVPSLLVMEIERVLRPGGTGAVLVGITPVVSFLKTSDVVHVCGVGSFTLVVFKKRLETYASFEQFQLPSSCPSVVNNKPFMKHIEPLPDKTFSYLPNLMNISSRNRLVYINIGAGEYAKTSVAKMSNPYCGNHHAGFEVFIIDHQTSVLSSYVTDPSIHFVYDPALSGDATMPEITSDEFLSAPADEEGFDFIRWFKETVSDGDFVVVMMKAKLVELNILVELFKTGEICRVDELFIRCSDSADCTALLGSLRKSGFYAHKWSGDD